MWKVSYYQTILLHSCTWLTRLGLFAVVQWGRDHVILLYRSGWLTARVSSASGGWVTMIMNVLMIQEDCPQVLWIAVELSGWPVATGGYWFGPATRVMFVCWLRINWFYSMPCIISILSSMLSNKCEICSPPYVCHGHVHSLQSPVPQSNCTFEPHQWLHDAGSRGYPLWWHVRVVSLAFLRQPCHAPDSKCSIDHFNMLLRLCKSPPSPQPPNIYLYEIHDNVLVFFIHIHFWPIIRVCCWPNITDKERNHVRENPCKFVIKTVICRSTIVNLC